MPNTTPESVLFQAIKALVGLLAPPERARLTAWLEARFDSRGYEARGFVERP